MVALFAGAQRVWAQRVGAQLVQFGTVCGGCAGWAVAWFVAAVPVGQLPGLWRWPPTF